MARYYYNKYNRVGTITGYGISNYASLTLGNDSWIGNTSYSINQSTGVVTLGGSVITVYRTDASKPIVFTQVYNNNEWEEYRWGGYLQYLKQRSSPIYTYSRGSFIEVIEAEDGAYPDDGISGIYWYVKLGVVFPELKSKIDGTVKTANSGWVKVDGVLKDIDKMWTKIDGILKEV